MAVPLVASALFLGVWYGIAAVGGHVQKKRLAELQKEIDNPGYISPKRKRKLEKDVYKLNKHFYRRGDILQTEDGTFVPGRGRTPGPGVTPQVTPQRRPHVHDRLNRCVPEGWSEFPVTPEGQGFGRAYTPTRRLPPPETPPTYDQALEQAAIQVAIETQQWHRLKPPREELQRQIDFNTGKTHHRFPGDRCRQPWMHRSAAATSLDRDGNELREGQTWGLNTYRYIPSPEPSEAGSIRSLSTASSGPVADFAFYQSRAWKNAVAQRAGRG
jgi:hypothetical protein